MSIVLSRPPNFAAIVKAFPEASRHGVIFAWGEDICNPSNVRIPPELLAHERMHGARQGTAIEAWWAAYIADPLFRYNEELLAHVAEYRVLVDGLRNRNTRAKLLQRTAARLIAPLYGYEPPVPLGEAMVAIRKLA